MDHRSTDDRLDRLMARYLAERDAEIIRDARPAADVARRARPGLGATLAPAMPGVRSGRPLPLAMLLAALLAALAAGAAVVGGRIIESIADPLSGLVTEEVAPGVLRVINDDAGHELAALRVVEIAVGLDGAVWMNGHGGLFRLGEPGITPGTSGRWRTELAVGTNGTVWSGDGYGLRSFDGERWVTHPLGIETWAIGPDESVWGAWPDENYWSRSQDGRKPPGFELARLEGDRWVGMDLTGWPDDLIGDASSPYGPGLSATADGSLWLFAADASERQVLMRYDGTTWAAVPTPIDPRWITDGPDGSWVLVDRNVGTHDGETWIARFADGTWSESRVQLPDATEYWSEDQVRPVVASDGAVWLRVNLPDSAGGRMHVFPEGCDGVARVVGSAWTHHLAGTCIWDMEPGRNGEVWVATWDGDMQRQEPGDVYLIRPDGSDS
jgi:hypothetical protein